MMRHSMPEAVAILRAAQPSGSLLPHLPKRLRSRALSDLPRTLAASRMLNVGRASSTAGWLSPTGGGKTGGGPPADVVVWLDVSGVMVGDVIMLTSLPAWPDRLRLSAAFANNAQSKKCLGLSGSGLD